MGNGFAHGLAALPLLQTENALPALSASGECVVLFRRLFVLLAHSGREEPPAQCTASQRSGQQCLQQGGKERSRQRQG